MIEELKDGPSDPGSKILISAIVLDRLIVLSKVLDCLIFGHSKDKMVL